MSNNVWLAGADARPRVWGLRRHQVCLAALAGTLLVDGALRAGAGWWEWVLGVALVLAALPGSSSRSWGEWGLDEVRYRVRRHLRWCSVVSDPAGLSIEARGIQRVWCYRVTHVGRWDLSGSDEAFARQLARVVESFAAAPAGGHVSVHVAGDAPGRAPTHTTVCASEPLPASVGWRPISAAVDAPVSIRGRVAVLERRDYLRTPTHVVRVIRATAFAPGSERRAIEAMSGTLTWARLSLHARVIGESRARRLTARAVHRHGVDAQVARRAGFRWSASREREMSVLQHRERAVAAGAALCCFALYIEVTAQSLEQLRQRVAHVVRVTRAAGLRLDLGAARQGDWFVYQLPGGGAW